MNTIRRLVKLLLREEIGRNYHTVDDSPHTFRSFEDYDILINPLGDFRYSLSVEFKGKKIGELQMFSSYEEADHAARMQIDNHRVKFMNSMKTESSL